MQVRKIFLSIFVTAACNERIEQAVKLNLRFDMEESRQLGIEGHVCELQLTTRVFAAIAQDPAEHSLYLTFRSIRPFMHWSYACCSAAACTSNAVVCASACNSPVHQGSPGPSVISSSSYSVAMMSNISSQDQVLPVFSLSPVHQSDLPVVAEVDSEESSFLVAALGNNSSSVDSTLQSDLANQTTTDVAVLVFLRSTLCPGGEYNQELANIYRAVNLSSSSSVLFTSNPLSAMVSKRVFQIFFLAISAYSVYLFANALQVIAGSEALVDGVKRLRILSLRGGGLLSNNGIVKAGLLLNKCPIPFFGKYVATQGLDDVENSTITLGAAKSNGYYFITSADASEIDPVTWTVEFAADNSSTWTQIGASVWRLSSEGDMEFFPTLEYKAMIMDRAQQMLVNTFSKEEIKSTENVVLVDSRRPLSWILAFTVDKIIYSSSFLFLAIAGFQGQAWCARWLWVALLMEDAIVTSIGTAIIGLVEPWFWREAVQWYIFISLLVGLSIGSFCYEKHVIAILLVYCFLNIMSVLVSEIVLYKRDLAQVILEQVAGLTFIGLIFCLLAIGFRHRALRQAYSLVLEDRRRYDATWEIFCSDPAVKTALLAVQEEVSIITDKRLSKAAVPRQYQQGTSITDNDYQMSLLYKMLKTSGLLSYLPWIKRRASNEEPVSCLDQLFVQAHCLNPILINKVQGWALGARGYFPSHVPGRDVSFVRFADVPTESACSILWASVKSSHRAIEKLVRVYGQDVSRLVDLCRQCIVFDDTADIAACLHVIHGDDDIKILRIKNRLDMEYDASKSGGYRDVVLNLIICNAETSALGVDKHVCEVQLIHRKFAELKSNEGHGRYVKFRNLRGE